ncbi:MAG: class I SAM-dependent methyltransferase [Ignavibacteriales bacterium]|nr:class I SAM-dependent methyltransferase [Ignavibacteriales bacterium]
MNDYYADKLSADRLKQVYEIAPPRVQQYFVAEVNHVLKNINRGDIVLDLGCGYGRIIPSLSKRARSVVGIDTSFSSLLMGKEMLSEISNYNLLQMDALHLGFRDNSFDVVVCIQNGISAFHIDQKELIKESIRVTKRCGLILFSTYSEKFWNHRLEWFQLQSEAGLLGEIDYEKTRNGVIVCKDGFMATTAQPEQFLSLVSGLNVEAEIVEVDESSLFCEMRKL